jgi:hypothetical protein
MGPKGLWGALELGQVRDGRVIKAQPPSSAQLHDRRTGKGLGDRRDPEDGGGVWAATGSHVGKADSRRPHELVADHDA